MRFALSMALRAELWLACALMYYMFASGQVLIMLLFVFLRRFPSCNALLPMRYSAAIALRLQHLFSVLYSPLGSLQPYFH